MELTEQSMSELFSSIRILETTISCPCCNRIIPQDEKAFNGLAANRKATLRAKLITANDMIGRLNRVEHKEQLLRLNAQINELKQELRGLGEDSIFIDGEVKGL